FTTHFIDDTKELFDLPQRQDRATKLLSYIGEIIVNGNPEVGLKGLAGAAARRAIPRETVPVPGSGAEASQTMVGAPPTTTTPPGMREKFQEMGVERFARWVLEQKALLVTDTTFRDAHQSLLATRMRTADMLRIAPTYAARHPKLFSLEMWGGATFDTALRFLKEDPWLRLADLRERVPNILLQMLLRANNAVGYKNYPDNVVKSFVKESAQAGIDLFRIFDALNWVPNLKLAIEAVRNCGMLCEPAICYTGDILDPKRTKYSLKYYVELAKELEKLGANILGIKDMAGLGQPPAARAAVPAFMPA